MSAEIVSLMREVDYSSVCTVLPPRERLRRASPVASSDVRTVYASRLSEITFYLASVRAGEKCRARCEHAVELF